MVAGRAFVSKSITGAIKRHPRRPGEAMYIPPSAEHACSMARLGVPECLGFPVVGESASGDAQRRLERLRRPRIAAASPPRTKVDGAPHRGSIRSGRESDRNSLRWSGSWKYPRSVAL
jgi:hypothetical protein